MNATVLESTKSVDIENATKQPPMKKTTKASQAVRRVFREVSNETAQAVNGNGKALKSSENIAKKIGKVFEKGTSTDDIVEKQFVCDRCQKNNVLHNLDEDAEALENFLTCDSLSEEDNEKYWETVCESTRECLKATIEEKDQISNELQKEKDKNKSLQEKVVILEAKMEVLKEYLKSELGIEDVEFSVSEDES